jgi:hypothetical protein
VSSKLRADADTGTAEQSNTITVWVWKDHYGGLHATDTPRPEASVRHVPLPTEAGPLQRLYGNLTRMIAEREAADGPVHTGRASLSVRRSCGNSRGTTGTIGYHATKRPLAI